MYEARWFWATVVTVAVVAALGVGLWFGGGPGTREGWEAASWAAGLTAALSLAVTTIVWATAGAPARDGRRSRSELERTGRGETTGRTHDQETPAVGPATARDRPDGASPASGTAAPDAAHLRRLARAHRDNIRILEHQLALFGPLHAPPHKHTELDIEKQSLARVEDLIRRVDDARR